MQELLEQIAAAIDSERDQGHVADYIPALGRVDPEQWGLSVCTVDGQTYSIGDASVPFSIQSISKVFGLTLAMQLEGEELWQRVGFEPSGLPFNSLVQLEHERGIPRNPFINAGAIVVTDVICSRYASPNLVMTDLARKLSGNDTVTSDPAVAESELQHGSRNAAMAYLMKSFGNFDNDVELVLKAYFSNCALTMSCEDLASSMSFLANQGVHPKTGQQILSPDQTRQVNALMATSGLYDEAGRFAFRVGMPGKSGVGGGIVAIVPGKLTICVWSPRLNEAGNSHAGMKTLELLSRELGWSVY